ncbi:MAG: hypothetical protein UV80_C0002G0302 [Candidatus Peregrinibacteria bacterium GW2011_GWF2_43_17]|nr:MAG: hypothetical protein UV80_C0002G0302 [Candidatus Peregrinibacteria bacterium GW2011_GWF2_43_17]
MSAVLILISSFIVIIMGYSSSKINHDIKFLNVFLEKTENLQSNFEESLKLYTESTQVSIEHANSIRPAEESEYINFISEVENIGITLNSDLNLRSTELEESENSTKGNTLDYELTFYGDETDITTFLEELERLSYYIKVYSIEYYDLNYTENENLKLLPNIEINIRLYVK